MFFFFFQAEDGIRDYKVTGVQTCALPIWALPGIPQHWLHFLLQAHPGFARHGWLEIEETHSSGYLVNDALNTSTLPWWTTTVRVGWNGTVGSLRGGPFVGFDNVFNRSYVGSVVINASGGRYYEPADRKSTRLNSSHLVI